MAKIYFQTLSHKAVPQLQVLGEGLGVLGHVRYNQTGRFWAYYPVESIEPLVSSSSLEQLKLDIVGFEEFP